MSNVVGVAQEDGSEQGLRGQGHHTSVVEQGRFCFVRCTCGWRGPARRARSLARTDGEGHRARA
ncbi:hypothetical protein ABT215_01125 [Streptomyces sp900105755]|uniref:hypothetical protein n=1 Tax=Streptomyces sp. 900105755 TaxID=3154389 RepID=UPI00115FDD2D|nr:hypothetical protein [Streptomyces sp. Ag109_O5-10]